MKRFGIPIAAILLAGAAYGIAPAASASATTSVAAGHATAGVCSRSPGFNGFFDRCTGTQWAPIACDYGFNFNGTNGPFNVLAADNDCITRVWLHQDPWNGTNWGNGWTFCIGPGNGTTTPEAIPPQFQHPLNIYISNTSSDPC